MRRFRFRLDPPLSRDEWCIILLTAPLGLIAGYFYAKWIFGVLK